MSGKIVFVIGAGTGPDIGMPLGDKLRMEIRRVLRVTRVDYVDQFAGDEKIRDAIEELVRDDSNDCDFGSYFSACKQIANSMPLVDSIDEYLDMHRDDKVIEIISKLAIVRCILADEANSDFKFDLKVPGALMDTAGLEKKWPQKLFSLLCARTQFGALASRFSRFVFINFNYDRCLETFLHHSIQIAYGKSSAEVAEILKSLRIIHPYGSVGPLPWENADQTINFGNEDVSRRLLQISKGIRTFAEQQQDFSSIYLLRQEIEAAAALVFLGFAFHDINIELLSPENPGDPYIFATVKGLKHDSVEMIHHELASKIGNKNMDVVNLVDTDCAGLFDEFGRRLSRIHS